MSYYTTYARSQDEIYSGDKSYRTFESALRSACKELLEEEKGWMEIDDGGIISPLASVHLTSAKSAPAGARFVLKTYSYVGINGGIGVKTKRFYLDKNGKMIQKKKKT